MRLSGERSQTDGASELLWIPVCHPRAGRVLKVFARLRAPMSVVFAHLALLAPTTAQSANKLVGFSPAFGGLVLGRTKGERARAEVLSELEVPAGLANQLDCRLDGWPDGRRLRCKQAALRPEYRGGAIELAATWCPASARALSTRARPSRVDCWRPLQPRRPRPAGQLVRVSR